jgi:hypothetical protein
MTRFTTITGVSALLLGAGLAAGCATAERDMDQAQAAGVDPVDVVWSPFDDTIDNINRRMNAPAGEPGKIADE